MKFLCSSTLYTLHSKDISYVCVWAEGFVDIQCFLFFALEIPMDSHLDSMGWWFYLYFQFMKQKRRKWGKRTVTTFFFFCQVKRMWQNLAWTSAFCLLSTCQITGLPHVSAVNNAPANSVDKREGGLIPELGRSPGGGHGNPSSILAWRIPWTEEPGRLQSIGLHKTEATEHAHMHRSFV